MLVVAVSLTATVWTLLMYISILMLIELEVKRMKENTEASWSAICPCQKYPIMDLKPNT